jgi:chromosome partitioning protein
VKVIPLLNQRDDSGKTTVATHLTRDFQLEGRFILLVDSDPQEDAHDRATVRG